MTQAKNGQVYEAIRANGALDQVSLERGCALAESESTRLETALSKLGLVEEADLLSIVAAAYDAPPMDLNDKSEIDMEALSALGLEYCQNNTIAPIGGADGDLVLATNDPGNGDLVSEIRYLLDRRLTVRTVSSSKVMGMLSLVGGAADKEKSGMSRQQRETDVKRFRDESLDGPVVRFVGRVLQDAVEAGASDIHFEPQADGLRVRFRVQGILRTQPVDRDIDMVSVIARVKVLSEMNVSERRLPQDGRIRANISGRQVDFRVSSVPTGFGESVVCRVLDPRSLRLGWAKLGFPPDVERGLIDVLKRPHGLVLVTGPTGSGKTTTLYTALTHLNRESVKILTVEDPVEYDLPGIEQVQVREATGLTFSRALRAFLRQDPDVIMVGEIRDRETAEIACRAALVGRLVLSTLHTNTPEDAQTRLVDLGVEPFIVRSVLRGVVGQRLISNPDTGLSLRAKLVLADT